MERMITIWFFFLASAAGTRAGDPLDQRLPGDGIPVEEANEIALKAFSKPGSVEENRLRHRNRRWTYLIRISDLKGHFYTYEVDALSGKWRKLGRRSRTSPSPTH